MSTETYQKIPSPYLRENVKPFNLLPGQWISAEVALLKDLPWVFTEKADGTNIRVGWDGHTVTFEGRTAKAEIPKPALDALTEKFPEELFEQMFGEKAVTLYGEMVGVGIGRYGRHYGEVRFVMFDVMIGGLYLFRKNVEDIARGLGVEVVPVVLTGTLEAGIEFMRSGFPSYLTTKEFPAEGVVGTTEMGLRNRKGERIIVKIKARDFEEGA